MSGKENRVIHSMSKPNCAPTCEYVATPLGSSSAAPVIRPGPRRVNRFSDWGVFGDSNPCFIAEDSDIPSLLCERGECVKIRLFRAIGKSNEEACARTASCGNL